MCSWCWAFSSSLQQLMKKIPREILIIRLLGGLAPDNDNPMSDDIRDYVIKNWNSIEKRVPETKFNYDFWKKCKPRRSTYPACRAIIAARKQKNEFDTKMTTAIQKAYYLQARNPSDYETLIELAGEIGADKNKFSRDVASTETDEILKQEIEQYKNLGLKSLPSLLFINDKNKLKIEPDYINPDSMLEKINSIQ